MVVGAMVGRAFDEKKIRTRQRLRRRVERTAATVSGVAAISEEGASDNKLTTLMLRLDCVGLAKELMVVRLICSDYNGTPSSSFESSSAGAYKIADETKFFSFGTNDLTQMTFGYSKDDVEKFLPIYLSSGILQSDPFEVLDQKGVGQLIKLCPEKVLLNVPNPVVLDIDVCALGMSIGIIYCYTGCLKASVEGGSISLGTKEYANED
ncbi:hypothetical protein Ahy_A07g031865 isoform B [Arachis hypogaea]|uniref:PEP-utilising enzyme C-terminal domain-containing protein n=1 Tax=Arachis hypogaea TaxID=3818 RepID=A0A445C5A2_ARAHY|nr:hypothetical protein Ahy_A07g031865 isoform B [Arachis hypogaea]